MESLLTQILISVLHKIFFVFIIVFNTQLIDLIFNILDSSGFSSPPPNNTIAFSPTLTNPLSLADLIAYSTSVSTP